jgi:3-carboxy-cis,cis-muconate cycloisomerase
MGLLEPLTRWSVVEEVFGDVARVQALLDFEAALARAEARAGVIDRPTAETIAGKCGARFFDPGALADEAARAGNVVIPLVERLRALVAAEDPAAATWVHWGATSQDAIDTSLVLLERGALDRIDQELKRLAAVLADLAERHRGTVLAGRTLLQQAVPITFGLKAAGWLDAVGRHRDRLGELRPRALVLQFGGAAGSLGALGERGLAVAEALAAELQLPLPDVPWHAHRDRLAEVGAWAAIGTGLLGKIARDLSLLGQTEIGEVAEPVEAGRGASSTMPHKRNPVGAATALAAALRTPGLLATMMSDLVQEGERGLGGLTAEGETLPELIGLFAGALHHLTDTLAGLQVDAERMRANLDASAGLVYAEALRMALARRIGGGPAAALVAAACDRARAEKKRLEDVVADDPAVTPHLTRDEIAALFDPAASSRSCGPLIDRALDRHRKRS